MKVRCLGCMEEYDNSFDLCPNCGYEEDTAVDSPLHMPPGSILHGQYLIGRVLGYGGFGVTYVGWDFKLERKVAIKEYLPSEFATRLVGQIQVSVFGGKKEEQFGDGMEQFVQEARRLAKFQNEDGIVKIYDSFSENNTAYIVMEYLDGETLAVYLERNGKIEPEKAIEMLAPVLRSLEVVHGLGIIHRDIAPDNIFLTKDGKVKLIDFGAARHATTTHSRSLTVIIKPGYSPEEQYRSRGDQGPHTDVYALGAVMYRMVTGITLPDSMERRANFERNGKDIVVPISKNCKISKNHENAIMNALNVRIEDRTATAVQFLEELTAQRAVKRIFGKIKITDLMRWPLWAKILVPVTGVAAAALLILLVTGQIGPNGNILTDIRLGEDETRVPSVVNYTLDVGEDRLAEKNLKMRVIGSEYSDVIPADMVLYQNLSAGQVVEKRSVVDVYVSTDQGSSGLEFGVMPNLVYKTLSDAETMMTSLGLNIKTEEVFDSHVAEGLVVSQFTAAGANVGPNATVRVEVSKGEDPNKPVGTEELVVLSRDEYGLYIGDSVTLRAEGGTGKYTYISSDESILTVDKNGKVTAEGIGTATITVASGKAQGATCAITVRDYEMTLNRETLTLFIEASGSLTVMGVPSNAIPEWSSANEAIATVDRNGKITGISTGETVVTASWKNPESEKTYTASVKIVVEAQGITLNTYKISGFYTGETKTITAKASSDVTSITWRSSDEKVAKVNQKGVVTAVGGGSAMITASFGEYTAECEVTVIQPGVSVGKSKLNLYISNNATLSASTTPSGVVLTWSSSDTSVATVNEGKIKAVGAGTATIRAKMTYSGVTYEATCDVKVSKPSVSMSQKSITLDPNGSKTISASTKPGGGTVTWSSDNSQIASVNNGKISAVSAGTTTVRAKMSYGGRTYEAACEVKVSKPSVTVSKSSLSLMPGDSASLSAKTVPGNSSVSWSSSNTSVATVNGGKVNAVAVGSADIVAKISFGGKTYTSTCKVTVEKPSISVTASSDTIEYSELERGTGKLTAKVRPDGGKVEWSISDSGIATIKGEGTTATVTAKSEGSVTVTATYTVKGTTVKDSCELWVKKAASTLKISNVRHPQKCSLNNFYFTCDISSNYQLTKLVLKGTAYSNATGLSASDSGTLTFNPGIYKVDKAQANAITEFCKDQYRTLYNLYVGLAGILGADNSLTMTGNYTVYDASGKSQTVTIKYVLQE